MLKKILLTTVAFLSLILSAQSQEFLPGVVIVGTDTLHASIKEDIIAGGDHIYVNINGSLKTLTVKEVTALKFSNGSTYVSAESVGISKPMFLKVLARGKVNLFSYYMNRNEIFVMTKGPEAIELDNSYQNITTESGVVQRPSNRYRGQLRVYLNDAPKLNSRFERTAYSARELTSLVRDYNAISGTEVPSEEFSLRERLFKIKAGIFASAGLPTLNVSDILLEGYYGVGEQDFDSNEAFTLGTAIFLRHRALNHFYLSLRPGYSMARYRSNVTTTNFNKVENQTTFVLKGINVPINLGYVMPLKSKLKPFVEVGIWRTYFTTTTSDFKYSVTAPSGATTQGSYDDFKFSRTQTGFAASVGLTTRLLQNHDVNFAVNYLQGSGIHENADNPSAAYKKLSSTKAIALEVVFLF
jgi:opacity protein-like surface antigen